MLRVKIHKKINQREKGFSLIETFVSIVILMMAIVSPMMLAQRSLNSASASKDQMVAYFLADEALEYVRSLADTNTLTAGNSGSGGGRGRPIDWMEGLSSCIAPNECAIDSTSGTVGSCTLFDDCLLYKNENVMSPLWGIYGHRDPLIYPDWQATVFKRKISITRPVSGSNDEAILRIQLSWQTGSLPARVFTVRENLLNWKKGI